MVEFNLNYKFKELGQYLQSQEPLRLKPQSVYGLYKEYIDENGTPKSLYLARFFGQEAIDLVNSRSHRLG